LKSAREFSVERVVNRNYFQIRTILLTTAIHLFTLVARGANGDTWVKKADMPTPRIGLSTCVAIGKIFAIGGYREAGAPGMATVEAYDPLTDSWTSKADMPTARLMSACAAVNGKIYVIGGDRRFVTSPMKFVEEYDPATDAWTRKTDMPTARSGPAAAVVDGRIYVIGGLTTFGALPLSTVEVYDPVSDTWERKAAMPTPRGLLHVSVVEGKIYAIGSSAPPSGPWLPTVEMYDPPTDTWSRKANMPTARGASAGGTVHGRIYVMGGRNSESSLATVEEYDPLSNKWVKRASMSAAPPRVSLRWNFSASEVNGRIYAIGGAFEVTAGHPGVSLVLEYTPPILPPVLQMKLVQSAGQDVLRLEWLSRTDCVDILQSQNQFQPGGWTEVEKLSGSGQTLTKEIPGAEPAAFYRLQREFRE
jgi:N-acetylneuraminic acid mutarotase